MSRVVHFEIPADDPGRAVGFYEQVFGWKFKKWEGPMDYWLIETGPDDEPGINGGLMKREQPRQGVCNTLGVGSVDDFVGKVTDAGGTIVVPKSPIPGVGYVAYGQDPEGNAFGLFEQDDSAVAE